MKRIMLCCLLSLSVLWASDLVVLTDGSMHIGRIVRYEADNPLLFEDLKGNQIVYTKGEILITRTNIDVESLIAVDWIESSTTPEKRVEPMRYHQGIPTKAKPIRWKPAGEGKARF